MSPIRWRLNYRRREGSMKQPHLDAFYGAAPAPDYKTAASVANPDNFQLISTIWGKRAAFSEPFSTAPAPQYFVTACAADSNDFTLFRRLLWRLDCKRQDDQPPFRSRLFGGSGSASAFLFIEYWPYWGSVYVLYSISGLAYFRATMSLVYGVLNAVYFPRNTCSFRVRSSKNKDNSIASSPPSLLQIMPLFYIIHYDTFVYIISNLFAANKCWLINLWRSKILTLNWLIIWLSGNLEFDAPVSVPHNVKRSCFKRYHSAPRLIVQWEMSLVPSIWDT